jgi:hypothetical protein
MSALGLEKLSGSAKALWTLATIVVSAASALVSTAIYIHDLIGKVDVLTAQVDSMSKQLKQVSKSTPLKFDFNGTADPVCPDGSFLTGLRVGADDHGNTHGNIWCAKVQPEIQ